ncbi:aminotransferase class V-fold PLP-dependent enzyme [Candidatus Liberibacter americanus]|uniref:cysteine desulfurase n=1 Tax=Candidatus Liberibacter americanus str. Sao Paulo TaxID=1261131 RepID=U6B8A5_9HYPH|nr:cysteine desulfurase [Candidatus Liberibacter americanus]AHA27967.1 Cysteine desulfurase, SufS subfamily [Candidatus Liberibacter americanus str. Sao Paulo]EMS35857.1 aminotransferase involved in iron-sulfur cluster biogenesis [Candidatus Liberibacter americanus PW_SP]
MTFDVYSVRRDFPILSRLYKDKSLIYFDNASSAQKPKDVIDSMVHTYSYEYSNIHRGSYFMSDKVTFAYENARSKICDFMNASSKTEIIFTKSSTEAINIVAYGWASHNISEGDEIVLSVMEHNSNIVPWHFLRERYGARLVWVPVDENGCLQIDEFKKCLTDRTKLVAITHMSNVLGTHVPIKDICHIAHERNIPVLVDGSQGCVHISFDVQDLDCDWYVMSGHKLYGPSGIGIIYGKKHRLEEMYPLMGGGGMISELTQDMVSYSDLPYRFEAGTPPISQAIAFGKSIDYMEKLNRESIFSYERELARYTRQRLKEVDGLRLVNDAAEDSPIMSFQLGNISPYDLSVFLSGLGICTRAGMHCANCLLQFLGVKYLCRASLAMYNTREEADKFVEALKSAHKFFS